MNDTTARAHPTETTPALPIHNRNLEETVMTDSMPSITLDALGTLPRARPAGRAPAPVRALARRWPALAGAALVTALLPAGVALAALGPTIFQSLSDTA